MRRRLPESTTGLPAELAAGPVVPLWGPDELSARAAWHVAGREWSRSNGHSWNGWLSLLPEHVRKQVYRRRLRAAGLDANGSDLRAPRFEEIPNG